MEFAAFCGAVRWHFCEPRDPQAKGCVERLQDFVEKSFEPGRRFASELALELQLDAWFDTHANPRVHKTLRCRPIDRLRVERAVMAPLPATPPDVGGRCVLRVPPDPYLRFDTCDYSLDPRLVGRRVEARATEREVLAMALDAGELACCPRAVIRAASHHHRARARPRAARPARRAPRRRDRGDETGCALGRADRMSRPNDRACAPVPRAEVASGRTALPKLADRAREESWT